MLNSSEENTIHSFTLKGKGTLLPAIITPVNIAEYNNSAKQFSTRGIWDTGASGTVITQEVVDGLSLQPTGIATVNTASERGHLTQTFNIQIHFTDKLVVSIPRATLGMISDGIGCLIGMDVITLGDFSITNYNNCTCMSFRIPSLHEIDYIKNPKLIVPNINSNSIGRNKLCPCGSGLKYKKCHGK